MDKMSDNYAVKKRGFDKPSQDKRKSLVGQESKAKGSEIRKTIPEDSLVAAANKNAKIRFNKHASTSALQTNFLEVKEIVLNELIEKFPLVAPKLHPQYTSNERTVPSLNILQSYFKEQYKEEGRRVFKEQTELWAVVKQRRLDKGLEVSRRVSRAPRTLRSTTATTSSVSAEAAEPTDSYDDFNLDDNNQNKEDIVDEQSELLFEPYEEAFLAWKISFRQQCLDNVKIAALKEYDLMKKADAKEKEEADEQATSLFSAIQGLLDYQLLRMLQKHERGKMLLAAGKKDPLALWRVVEHICLYPSATSHDQVIDAALNDYVNFPACSYKQDIYTYNERYKIVRNNYLQHVGQLPNFSSLKHYTDRIKSNKFETLVKRVQADLLETKGKSYTLQGLMDLLEELDLQLEAKKPASAPVYGAWAVKTNSKGKSESKEKGACDTDYKKQKTETEKAASGEKRVCHHCKLPGHLKSECQVLRAQTLSGKGYKCCEEAPAQQHHIRVMTDFDPDATGFAPILDNPSFCGSVRRKDEVIEFIWDSGSQETITCFPHTLSNKTKGPSAAFESMAGLTSSCIMGDLGPFGKAYLGPVGGNIIVLSQASMLKQFGSDMHVYFNNEGNYYDVTLHGVCYRFEADETTDKPLYKLRLPVSAIHVNTVHKNEEGLSRREREKNHRCIRLISDAGYNDVKEMLAHGMITECEETSTDVAAALRVHGYPAGWHQGKTVTKSSKLPRIEPALPYLIKQQDLEVDLMFTAGIGFLISVSRPLGMTIVTHIGGKGAPMLRKAMQVVLKLYQQRGFELRRITVDGESSWVIG